MDVTTTDLGKNLSLECLAQNLNELTHYTVIHREHCGCIEWCALCEWDPAPQWFQVDGGFFSGKHLVYLGSHPLTFTWTNLKAPAS